MKARTVVAALALSVLCTGTSLAAGWQQDSKGWWWQFTDGSGYPRSTWMWADGNGDGSAECYYFDQNGYCLMNTTTPDGYTVNANGAWVVNGAVQTKNIGKTSVISVASTKQYTDQFTKKNGNFYYGDKLIQEFRAYGDIKDMVTYYSISNASIMYLETDSWGDAYSTPLVEGLELRINKDAQITYSYWGDNQEVKKNVTAEAFKNTCTYFTPSIGQKYYDNATVVLFPNEFDASGAVTKARILEFG